MNSISLISLSFLGLCLAGCQPVASASLETRTEGKPNFLYIMTDEHNFRTIGAYRDLLPEAQAKMWGETVVETPNLDYLADNGAILTSMYATSPSCTPSRAAMFTGDYPQTNGIEKNGKSLRRDVPTIANVLADRGYRTGYVGKWHLIGNEKPMWAPEYSYGFEDKAYMFNGGHWKGFKFDKNGTPKVMRRPKGTDQTSFATDWLTTRTLDFIKASKDTDKPFFHVLSILDPHTPNTVRAPYDTMYALEDIKVPATWNVHYDDNMPKWWNPEIDAATKFKDPKTKEQYRGRPKISNADMQRMIRENTTQYFGMVKAIDDNIGRIIETLKKTGELENTVIIFSADHGDLLGEHGRDNKGVPYEGSAKVPFIVYYPSKIKPGTVIDKAANNTDMMDTVLSLMDVKNYDQTTTDGRDLTPWLEGRESALLKDLTFVRYNGWAGAFTDRYKLVFEKTKTQPWLFDLEKDPTETVNYFTDPAYTEIIQSLSVELLEYGETYEDSIVLSKQVKSRLKELAAK
ncbi:sulfatase family protein [Robiginitomaculum antarcticum]|uniref:sulfatase family protein n=1 Tax=Robiginitomaculum antarcticum TaxID=437507 RepID=UPI001F40693A|nr:sulfatase [Robiginitomaculum antarcticum]